MATKGNKTETIAFKVDPELKQKAELLAEEDSSNVSIIARKALQFYVTQKSPINTKSAKKAS